MADLELRSVAAYWNRRRPVGGFDYNRSVSLSIRAGSWVLVAGPNGIGKSTLLHAIAGTATFVSGEILVGSSSLDLQDSRTRYRLGVQMVPQNPSLVGGLSWDDAYELFRLTRPALDNGRAVAFLRRQLEHCGLIGEDGAVQPRVFDLVSAILTCPRVLLLDEIVPAWPDPRESVAGVYRRIREALPSSTVLFTEHNLRQAIMVADGVLWLKSDSPPEYFDTDKVEMVEQFLREMEVEAKAEYLLSAAGTISEDGNWQEALRLDRTPLEQLGLALQARGLRGTTAKAKALKDFGFLNSDEPAESLSGGQRTVLRWFLLNYAGVGALPEAMLRHLDAGNREKIEQWNRKLADG